MSWNTANAEELMAPSDTMDSELAQRILEAVPNIIYVYDVQKQESIFQNRSFASMLKHPVPDIAPSESEWRRFIHPDDAKSFPQHREKLKFIKPGETVFWEFRMRDADGHWRWFLSRDTLLSADKAGKPLQVVGTASDITEQKRAEQHKEILVGEMRHRAKNFIPVIEGIARLSRPKGEPKVDAFVDAFMGRLMTLLRTGDVVLSSSARKADVRAVLELTFAPFLDEEAPGRLSLKGPAVGLSETTSGSLALAIHELATNAVKYGALSTDAGKIEITWDLAKQDNAHRFSLTWRETGGPVVTPPEVEGFGSRVIRHSVSHEPNGKIVVDYRSEGVHCLFAFDIPLEA